MLDSRQRQLLTAWPSLNFGNNIRKLKASPRYTVRRFQILSVLADICHETNDIWDERAIDYSKTFVESGCLSELGFVDAHLLSNPCGLFNHYVWRDQVKTESIIIWIWVQSTSSTICYDYFSPQIVRWLMRCHWQIVVRSVWTMARNLMWFRESQPGCNYVVTNTNYNWLVKGISKATHSKF